MTVSINVNGLTQCHKGSGGVVRATLPDLCRTPSANNAPLPYPNVAFSRDLAKGTSTVFADGGHSCANRGSEFSKSIGDEPGSGGGVKSGTHLDRATWLSWSRDVLLEGRPACRLSDKMLMNDGNTASLGGLQQQCLSDDEITDLLCEYACDCKGVEQKQRCVSEKIRRAFYDGAYPRADSQIWREVSFRRLGEQSFDVILNRAGTGPTSNGFTPMGGIRPDCVIVDSQGSPKRIIEMKFPGDALRDTQKPGGAYDMAAQQHGAEYDVLEVGDQCDCWDDGSPPGDPVTALSTNGQDEEGFDLGGAAKVAGVAVVAGIGLFACFASGLCEAAAAATAGAAGLAAITQ
ncbi:PAAR-like domain-containing protein [Rhodovulum sulfidophilum]|uniref:PAAR-like domain-containing protein n=1 Tax=Rhodovulum sulfidophilum TaxID=35806 RepID=UPI00138964EB|nr:PAAR-like domain-containing protein [Rhodovulum sulfidophilum]NDK36838.1 DUF4150 domain-containing protein [Rhodovulum sulfidophilum]